MQKEEEAVRESEEQALEAESNAVPDAAESVETAANDQQPDSPAADAAQADVSALQAELAKLRQEADENHQRFLRTQADFDNFRRRSRQEKEDFAKYASLKLIEQLLPVVDNLERALAAAKLNQDADALTKGVEMTFRQLEQVLEQEGLVKIESVGQPFNPEIHQAIMQVESEEHEEGTVVEEVLKGYMLKDKILRPAMVKVAQ